MDFGDPKNVEIFHGLGPSLGFEAIGGGGEGGGVVAYRLYDKMRWFTFFAGPRWVLKSRGKN